ncbi:MAG: methylmalonyl-CoA mutase [Methylocystis sp.]|nr:methylmalonyl-CoA mutase [Methylocystis sp.]MCA3585491.1 methylmalonyl-CoA mutase [Methylocystis sp.]MCA3589885.1 methylmalonyl-CoA mutase [Methylocystis sp.]MCA3591439.1 methylmalonyl-CoA mutase [Methylocystis sp.]
MSDAETAFVNPFPNPSEAEWRARVDSVLKGGDFTKKLVSRTHDGLSIQPLYARRAEATLVTGAAPGQPWRVMCRVDHPDAEAAAAQAREDLEGGADALALAMAGGRSARGYGIASDRLAELDAVLAGVHLDLIRLRLDLAPGGPVHALAIAALLERRKLNPAQVEIDFGMDLIGALTLPGQPPGDWGGIAAQLGETILALKARGFRGPFLTVDLRPWHEAGASEGQELAAALASGVLSLRALEAQGMALDEAFSALSFIVPVDADQFLGIAKLRALRKLWAKAAAACGITPAPALIHAETSWRMLTRRDSHVNILRNTIAAFAAGVGGAETVTVLPFTQALGLPDAAARRLARNTSIVLMEEAGLWRVADPAAGAGGYEALTDALAAKAWALFQEIESEGGLLASLTGGHLQSRIAATAAARAKAAATRREPITGTSEFADLAELAPAVLDVPPRTHPAAQISAIAPLVSHRTAEPFEALRDRADAILAATGQRPRVTLVTLGALADHAARLAFTRNLFEAGGIEIAGDSPLACLVGSDAAYAAEGAASAASLKASGKIVWLAGRPSELEAALRTAGVTRFVFAGCDVIECLGNALELAR